MRTNGPYSPRNNIPECRLHDDRLHGVVIQPTATTRSPSRATSTLAPCAPSPPPSCRPSRCSSSATSSPRPSWREVPWTPQEGEPAAVGPPSPHRTGHRGSTPAGPSPAAPPRPCPTACPAPKDTPDLPLTEKIPLPTLPHHCPAAKNTLAPPLRR